MRKNVIILTHIYDRKSWKMSIELGNDEWLQYLQRECFVFYTKSQRSYINNYINSNETTGFAKVMTHLENTFNKWHGDRCKRYILQNLLSGYQLIPENSLTAWCNLAVENFGLTIGEVKKMKKGEIHQVLLFDRNLGDKFSPKHGETYNPIKSITTATYIHDQGLCGRLEFHEIDVVYEDWQWGFNSPLENEYFWNIRENIDVDNLDDDEYIGWRGPAILAKYLEYLPKEVTYNSEGCPFFRRKRF